MKIKYKIIKALFASSLLALVLVSNVKAGQIAAWNPFVAEGATYPKPADITDASVTSAGINTANIRHLSSAFNLGGVGTAPDGSTGHWNTAAGVVDLAQYFELDVSVNANSVIDFTSLELFALSDGGGLAMTVRSSLDGFVGDVGIFILGTTNVFKKHTIDLSGLPEVSGGDVQFRVYGNTAPTSSDVFFVTTGNPSIGDGNQRFIALNGDVSAVPVPAAVWLFGSALIGLVGVKRRG